jgi:ferrous iron transport protein B
LQEGVVAGRAAAVRRIEAGLDPRASAAIARELGTDPDIVIASGRYELVARLVQASVRRIHPDLRRWSDRIDVVVLHRALGLPIFLVCMYLLFMLTINVGGAFVDVFDILVGHVLVDGTGLLLDGWGSPAWLTTVLASGVGGGLTTVATFIPILVCLFLLLTFLEDSGYMARAAFVMDRLLRALGLPGKAFVPMILGFGCTIPAVMATRTLDDARDRRIAVAMAPFMSCGARLPVYALFAAAFFPIAGQNVVFALYLIGIAAAIATGLILRRTLLPGPTAAFVMELPPYHLPAARRLLRRTAERTWSFLEGAGRVIVLVVVVLTVLGSLTTDGRFDEDAGERSVLAAIGKSITPALAPMGITQDNWPATVGLFTGLFAKEAVVGALDALYGKLTVDEGAAPVRFDLPGALDEAKATVTANLAGLTGRLDDPLAMDVAEAAPEVAMAGTLGAMQERFDGRVGAFAYLLMVLLYAPCVAALGAIWRETGPAWATFAAIWTTGLGYVTAVVFYQLATFARDPLAATAWIAAMLLLMSLVFVSLARIGRTSGDLAAQGAD